MINAETCDRSEKCFIKRKMKNGGVRYYPKKTATEIERAQLKRFNKLLDYISGYYKSDISSDY